jgi:hypothetical protein
MAITGFDRTSCRILSRDIEEALQAIAAKHGIVIRPGRGTFSGGHFTLKVECSTVSQDGTVNSKEAEDFKRYAALYSLQADDLGKTITLSFERYTIGGIRPKATRFPILAKRVKDGRVFCLPVDGVRRALEQQEPGRKKAPEAPVEKWPHGLQPINS